MSEDDGIGEQERQEAERARELLRIVEFGLQTEEFLQSPYAQRMEQEADAERLEIMQALLLEDTDTEEGRKNARELRQRAAVLTQWRAYLQEFVDAGKVAQAQYEEAENPVSLES